MSVLVDTNIQRIIQYHSPTQSCLSETKVPRDKTVARGVKYAGVAQLAITNCI